MLIAMKKHIEEERVLVRVQVEREHLKEFSVVDAEPGQRFRIR